MKIGFARVSAVDQNTNSKLDALKAAGCEKVVNDKVSGVSAKRLKLDKLLFGLHAGDVFTVCLLGGVVSENGK